MIDVKKAAVSLATLANLSFFPADEMARTGIVSEVCEMCSDNEQVEWLSRRARRLWRKWEGVYELRALLCSKFRPADGFEVYSSLPQFADGIPSEKESTALAIPAAQTRQIASAEPPVSVSPSLVANIAALVVAKDLNRAVQGRKPPAVPEIPVTRQVFTAADIERAVAEMRERKAREAITA